MAKTWYARAQDPLKIILQPELPQSPVISVSNLQRRGSVVAGRWYIGRVRFAILLKSAMWMLEALNWRSRVRGVMS